MNRTYGVHCACCNRSYKWTELIGHLNVKAAHKRPSIISQPPPLRASTPESSCSGTSSSRYHPYRATATTPHSPSTSRREASLSTNRHDPYLTPALSVPQAALGAPPASPANSQMVYTINTGFGAPPAAMEPTPRTHQLGVGYGLLPATARLPASPSSQLPLLHIPSSSFTTPHNAATAGFAAVGIPVLGLHRRQLGIVDFRDSFCDNVNTQPGRLPSTFVSVGGEYFVLYERYVHRDADRDHGFWKIERRDDRLGASCSSSRRQSPCHRQLQQPRLRQPILPLH